MNQAQLKKAIEKKLGMSPLEETAMVSGGRSTSGLDDAIMNRGIQRDELLMKFRDRAAQQSG